MIADYTYYQFFSLILGIILNLVSIVLWYISKNRKWALIVLFTNAFLIRILVTHFIPYLNYWDERFHALVAKNLVENPLKPCLYRDPALPYDFRSWDSNHVWFHKQPLFLWQMALFIWIFGNNEWAIRMPSAILSAFICILIYLIGKRLLNEKIGYLSALLYSLSGFSLSLVTGVSSTEHNDVSFVFYITLSFWLWIKYMESHKYIDAVFIGIAAGCAVLTKFLVGLIIYGVWFIVLIYCYKQICRKHILQFIFSICIAFIVFMPWQLYALMNYPKEYKYEFFHASMHFSQVIEGHEGDWLYHIEQMNILYADFIPVLIWPAILLLFFKIRKKQYSLAVLVFFLSIELFFMIAKTKMQGFTYPVLSVVFVAIGTLLYETILWYKPRYKKYVIVYKVILIMLIGLSTIWFMNWDFLKEKHTCWKKEMCYHIKMNTQNVLFFKKLNALNLPENAVILNLRYYYDNIQMMFYTPYTAYGFIPDEAGIQVLKNSNRPIYILNSGNLEEFIKKYPFIKVLDASEYVY